MKRIRDTFSEATDRKIVSLFLTAGFPTIEDTAELVLQFEKNGVDMVELGIPFSDPLADGPVIQQASEVAIQNGVNIVTVFDIVRQIRQKSHIPLVLMGYLNPIMHYGIEQFCTDAAQAGADGLIIPDLPLEEESFLAPHAQKNDLGLIYLVAPNTSDERMRLADERSGGFVYCVSVTGVTGQRDGEEVARSVNSFIERVRTNVTLNPVMIGFGIKSAEDAQTIAARADGFIVGSALISVISQNYPNSDWMDRTLEFVRHFRVS